MNYDSGAQAGGQTRNGLDSGWRNAMLAGSSHVHKLDQG